jgi:hypothetical protein
MESIYENKEVEDFIEEEYVNTRYSESRYWNSLEVKRS